MKDNIVRFFLNDLEGLIMEGLESDKESFPYTLACIHFTEELKNLGKDVDFDAFDPEIQNLVYQELSDYIIK